MNRITRLAFAMAMAIAMATPACGRQTPEANEPKVNEQGTPGLSGGAFSPSTRTTRLTLSVDEVNGVRIDELSGLAWDEDEQLLYAISDKGNVVHFRLALDGDTLASAEAVYAAALADPDGKRTARKKFDAEGLTVQKADNGRPGDTTLVVSLEGGDRPGILRFSPAGTMLGELRVPAPLDDVGNYRKKKQGLESVAFHDEYGLLTAPESPLQAVPDGRHVVYARDRHWAFVGHAPKSRLKAVDVLADGSLLALERSRLDSSDAMTPTLRRVDIKGCPARNACTVEDLATLPAGLNNFEGMTVLDDKRVLIVSDQGGKDRQATTLALLVLPGT